jgi:hypothetical protein
VLLKSELEPVAKKGPIEEAHKVPDLGRSFTIAERLLKKRKDSSSSMDISLRESKVRAEISISLALESRHTSKVDLSAFYKDIQGKHARKGLGCQDKINTHL